MQVSSHILDSDRRGLFRPRFLVFNDARKRFCAFTLIELLVVIGIVIVLMALMGPAFTALTRAGGATKAYYDIAGLLEQARTYAQANNTYAFVGFAEMDVAQPEAGPQKPGVGRLFTATVASKDGTRGYDYLDSDIAGTWKKNYSSGSRLIAVSPLRSFENLHLASTLDAPPSSGPMQRYSAVAGQRLGSATSVTPFNWPLGMALTPAPTSARQIYFDRVLMFDPTGAVRMGGGGISLAEFYELGLQPTRGNVTPPAVTTATANTGDYCAIMIDGLGGSVRVYRP